MKKNIINLLEIVMLALCSCGQQQTNEPTLDSAVQSTEVSKDDFTAEQTAGPTFETTTEPTIEIEAYDKQVAEAKIDYS